MNKLIKIIYISQITYQNKKKKEKDDLGPFHNARIWFNLQQTRGTIILSNKLKAGMGTTLQVIGLFWLYRFMYRVEITVRLELFSL